MEVQTFENMDQGTDNGLWEDHFAWISKIHVAYPDNVGNELWWRWWHHIKPHKLGPSSKVLVDMDRMREWRKENEKRSFWETSKMPQTMWLNNQWSQNVYPLWRWVKKESFRIPQLQCISTRALDMYISFAKVKKEASYDYKLVIWQVEWQPC